MGNTQLRKYEEHAYVLDYKSHTRAATVSGRTGTIVIALGEERLTLLEILGIECNGCRNPIMKLNISTINKIEKTMKIIELI